MSAKVFAASVSSDTDEGTELNVAAALSHVVFVPRSVGVGRVLGRRILRLSRQMKGHFCARAITLLVLLSYYES